MMIESLIEKFKRRECNAFEQEEVLAYFEANPEKWDKYMNEDEFREFEPGQRLSPAHTKKLFDKISKETIYKRFGAKKVSSYAIAASVILLLGFGWILTRSVSRGDIAKPVDKATTQLASLQRQQSNKTNKLMMLSLDDGSVIGLYPNSVISYSADLKASDRRTIHLIGKASFKVTKDPSRVFTVYSGELSTTALGTSFTVTAFLGENRIKVALHEGEVVVRSADSINKSLQKDVFLLPGDELTYSRNSMLARVSHLRTTSGAEMARAGSDRKTDPGIAKPEWYMFRGASLSQVLGQLSDYYQVEIYYYPTDIKNMYFTSRLEKNDSLENILKDIALLNKLHLDKKNGAYYFTRETH
jgi:hypothetical protein